MSEPMDLEKAKETYAKMKYLDGMYASNEHQFSEAKGFLAGAASERRAIMEKFRPVIEDVERGLRLIKVSKRNGTLALANAVVSFKSALALWREIEKENGQ